MKISQKGLDLIFHYETGDNIKKYLKAYQDTAGVWTIGIGSTYYEDGIRVKKGDVITEQRARQLFANILPRYEKEVNDILNKYAIKLNQNQYDALIAFVYNVGGDKFSSSTMLKKLKVNPNDPTIAGEFAKYKYSGGRITGGLINRRADEAALYFGKPYPVWTEGNDLHYSSSANTVVSKKTASGLNLRTGPGTGYGIVQVLNAGTEVNILSVQGDWSEVLVCKDKLRGWVSSKYLK